MVKLILVGCKRYNFKGELYSAKDDEGKVNVFMVSEDKANVLKSRRSENGRVLFREVQDETKLKAREGDSVVAVETVIKQGGDTSGIDEPAAPVPASEGEDEIFTDDGVDTGGDGKEITV